ncbi:uncharacterized protein [Prorops nasuta]|uniref:uncharacterized protein n=1 Tax=Prorops nasuta TaxID=863751 RepID=UPI0034CEE4D1
MNVANFASEFSQMILRWTVPGSPRNGENADTIQTPLTRSEVVNTVQEVLGTILRVDIPDQNNLTPATIITIQTPNAPSGPKLQKESSITDQESDYVFQHSPVPDTSSQFFEKMEVTDSNDNILSHEKKIMESIRKLERSGTFTRDEAVLKSPSKSVKTEKIESSSALSKVMYDKLETLRKSAMDVVSQIDSIKMPPVSQSTRALRRLSSIGFPGAPQSTAVMRAIPPPKMRRSITSTTFPATPTSSRLTSKEKETLSKQKSSSSTSLNLLGTPRLSLAVPQTSDRRSSTSSIKKTPSPSGVTKNPKYAHVQSTIPKAKSICKRKNM